MARGLKLLLTATIAAIAGVCFAQQQSSIRLATRDAPIHLDGRLDEPAWTNAAAVTLVEQSPHPGSATPYTTTIRVIADHNPLQLHAVRHRVASGRHQQSAALGERPNADLFVVWNRGWQYPSSEDDRFLTPLSDQFVAKLRWVGRW